MWLPTTQDSINRLYSVYDTHVTTISKVFMKMLHLYSICLSLLFVSCCQHPPWKSLDCKVGLAGGGLECGIEKLKTYSTYHSIPDDYSSRLFLGCQWKIKWYATRHVWCSPDKSPPVMANFTSLREGIIILMMFSDQITIRAAFACL